MIKQPFIQEPTDAIDSIITQFNGAVAASWRIHNILVECASYRKMIYQQKRMSDKVDIINLLRESVYNLFTEVIVKIFDKKEAFERRFSVIDNIHYFDNDLNIIDDIQLAAYIRDLNSIELDLREAADRLGMLNPTRKVLKSAIGVDAGKSRM